MGRPIKSKFFGNTNTGTGTSSDNHIGGEGIATVSVSNAGSYRIDAGHAQPTITVAAPEIPTGVRATLRITWEVDTITSINGLSGHGYIVGSATLTGGPAGVTANVTAVGSGQGEIQTIVPVNRGSFTSVPVVNTSYQVTQVGHGDGNQQVSIQYRIKTIAITEAGSGYRSAPAVTISGSGSASVTTTLKATQQNALDFTAYIPGGSSAKIGDILSQWSDRSYRVRTADGVGICKLAAEAPAEGEMMLIATDHSGATYYVTRLNERTARLVRKTGGSPEFASGTYVPWTFGSAVSGYSVTVANK